MPQITTNSSDLVREAYQLIRIIDDNDLLTASQLQTGITFLNQIISFDEETGAMVPYAQILNFNLIPGKFHYIISNNSNADVNSNPIAEIVNASIILSGNVRWPLQVLNSDQYYNNLRPQETNGQPFYLFFQKENSVEFPNSCFIEVWPVPNTTYEMSIYCKLTQDNFVQSTTINAPGWYTEYLQYCLARKLSERYHVGIWDDRQESRYKELYAYVHSTSNTDYVAQTSPAMQGSAWQPLASNQPYP